MTDSISTKRSTSRVGSEPEPFRCTVCHYETLDNSNFRKHMNSKSHKSAALSTVINDTEHKNSHSCPLCTYTTVKRSNFKRHMIMMHYSDRLANRLTCHCGKSYESQSGLYKHRLKCQHVIQTDPVSALKNDLVAATPAQPDLSTAALTGIVQGIVVEFSKVTQEAIRCSQESNNELLKKIIDVIPQLGAVANTYNTNNTTHTNSHNKTFNLQFFLNEQCKDAVNINEFVNNIPLDFNDLETMGKLGYVDGMTQLLSSRLAAMDIFKRPIHCTDAKRNIIHVRHQDQWQKESIDYPILQNELKQVGCRLFKCLSAWQQANPQSLDYYSPVNDVYMKYLKQVTGGVGDFDTNNNKIINKLSKRIAVDKDALRKA